MKEPIVLESNQNHATITDNGICPTLPASMGMGGGYIPMIVTTYKQYRYEVYEPSTHSATLRACTGDIGGGAEALIVEVKDEDGIRSSDQG